MPFQHFSFVCVGVYVEIHVFVSYNLFARKFFFSIFDRTGLLIISSLIFSEKDFIFHSSLRDIINKYNMGSQVFLLFLLSFAL